MIAHMQVFSSLKGLTKLDVRWGLSQCGLIENGSELVLEGPGILGEIR